MAVSRVEHLLEGVDDRTVALILNRFCLLLSLRVRIVLTAIEFVDALASSREETPFVLLGRARSSRPCINCMNIVRAVRANEALWLVLAASWGRQVLRSDGLASKALLAAR